MDTFASVFQPNSNGFGFGKKTHDSRFPLIEGTNREFIAVTKAASTSVTVENEIYLQGAYYLLYLINSLI